MTNLYHHTFRPWRVQGDTRVVDAESAWQKVLKWNKDAEMVRVAEDGRLLREKRRNKSEVQCTSGGYITLLGWDSLTRLRPRVWVDVDPFEDWQGWMVDERGERLYEFGLPGKMRWVTDRNVLQGIELDMCGRKITMQDVRNRLFSLIDQTPNLDWAVTTKYPENVLRMWPKYDVRMAFGNLWLGVSCENQQAADERIPHLLRVPAAVRFLSCEPLLGPVDLSSSLKIMWQCSGCREYFPNPYQKICPKCGKSEYWTGSHAFNGKHRPPNDTFPPQIGSGIDWVIVGGESGPNARPCNVEWIRDIVRQCKAAGVPVFCKQLGSRPQMTWREYCNWHPAPPAVDCHPSTIETIRLRDRKGVDIAEFPSDLQVREFPEVRA